VFNESLILLTEKKGLQMNSMFRFWIVLMCVFIMSDLSSAQWIRTNGPYGDKVTVFAVSGTNLFAGTLHNGVILSANNGDSWTAVNTGLKNSCFAENI
jgi:hypothetical protein